MEIKIMEIFLFELFYFLRTLKKSLCKQHEYSIVYI